MFEMGSFGAVEKLRTTLAGKMSHASKLSCSHQIHSILLPQACQIHSVSHLYNRLIAGCLYSLFAANSTSGSVLTPGNWHTVGDGGEVAAGPPTSLVNLSVTYACPPHVSKSWHPCNWWKNESFGCAEHRWRMLIFQNKDILELRPREKRWLVTFK